MYRFLFLLSVLPAVIIFLFIMKHDQEDKDKGFLFGIFGLGALFGIVACIIEIILTYIFFGDSEPYSILGLLFDNFLIVAITEELCKYFAMRILTWNNYRFNSTYDGVVYGVCSALGFATLENILYVFESGDGAIVTALVRAFMSVPFHAMCGIIWGYGYGIAKYRTIKNMPNAKAPIYFGILFAVLYHGFYDFLLSAFDLAGFLIAIVIVILGYIFIFGKAKKAARDDELFYTYMPPFKQNQAYNPYVPFYGRMQYPVNYQVNRPGLNPGTYYYGFRMPVNQRNYQSNSPYQQNSSYQQQMVQPRPNYQSDVNQSRQRYQYNVNQPRPNYQHNMYQQRANYQQINQSQQNMYQQRANYQQINQSQQNMYQQGANYQQMNQSRQNYQPNVNQPRPNYQSNVNQPRPNYQSNVNQPRPNYQQPMNQPRPTYSQNMNYQNNSFFDKKPFGNNGQNQSDNSTGDAWNQYSNKYGKKAK